MARFYTGDELGSIKRILCTRKGNAWSFEDKIVHAPDEYARLSSGEMDAQLLKTYAVQRLSFDCEGSDGLVSRY